MLNHTQPTPRKFGIKADHREHAPELIAELESQGCRVETMPLSLGDYELESLLIVERKTLPDFATSVIDGRLFKQAARLAAVPSASVLILEGTGKDAERCPLSREAMQGALISLSLIYHIPILRSMSQEESARLMLYAAEQIQRTRSGSFHRPGYRPKGLRKQKLFLLQGIPGIGPRRAEKLLDHFGTIEQIITAGEHELQQVDEIGPAAAQKIRMLVQEYPEYARYAADNEWPNL